MKFRKKPVVIEATQWFKDGDHPAVYLDLGCIPTIDTLEGRHVVTPGDWIITGVKGEHYPCKPDIFAMTYEPAEQQTPEYLIVQAEPRYWEDASVNGVEDTDGSRIPCRHGDEWHPVIRLSDGAIINWKPGTTASIHYKVCDQGEYWLADANKTRVAKYESEYVPDCLCPQENGYGDYIIMDVDANGMIEGWNAPDTSSMWGGQP